MKISNVLRINVHERRNGPSTKRPVPLHHLENFQFETFLNNNNYNSIFHIVLNIKTESKQMQFKGADFNPKPQIQISYKITQYIHKYLAFQLRIRQLLQQLTTVTTQPADPFVLIGFGARFWRVGVNYFVRLHFISS